MGFSSPAVLSACHFLLISRAERSFQHTFKCRRQALRVFPSSDRCVSRTTSHHTTRMSSHSGVAFSEYSFQSSRSPSNYFPMASSSYSPRDTSVSTHDLSSLAHHFGQQSLRHDSRNVSTAYHQPVPQSHATASAHNGSLQSHQSSVRSQRQANSTIQCQAGHTQQISSLVEHMVATGQCSVCDAVATSHIQPSESWEDETIGQEEEFEDEGFEEPPQMARLTYRRSTDLTAGGQGYVAKAIRVRKKHRSDPSRLR